MHPPVAVNDDNIKDGIKRSMSLPWTPRPLYSHRAQDTTPHGIRKDRRVRMIRRWWYDLRDDIGAFLWVIVGLMIAAMLWLGLDGFERIGRHVH